MGARGRTLSEHASLQLLASHGIAVVRHALVNSAAAAVAAAERIGFPVAVKACSPELPHKTEAGVVRLNLADRGAVERAYGEVCAAARGVALDGVLVQAMADGVEMIAGIAQDPEFGPTVLLGMGGVLVDLLGDVSLRVAPVSHDDAIGMIRTLRGAALLDGYRGTAAANTAALADLVVALGRLAVAQQDRIHAVDINPILVSAAGAVAVDALVVLREGAT